MHLPKIRLCYIISMCLKTNFKGRYHLLKLICHSKHSWSSTTTNSLGHFSHSWLSLLFYSSWTLDITISQKISWAVLDPLFNCFTVSQYKSPILLSTSLFTSLHIISYIFLAISSSLFYRHILNCLHYSSQHSHFQHPHLLAHMLLRQNSPLLMHFYIPQFWQIV